MLSVYKQQQKLFKHKALVSLLRPRYDTIYIYIVKFCVYNFKIKKKIAKNIANSSHTSDLMVNY